MYATYPCRIWFWDRVSAINEFICDTSIHKGQRGVTMATNFGTKFATNAFLWEMTRIWLLVTGSFRGRPIQRRYYWLQGSKRRCHGNQILAKIGKKSHKMDITSVVWKHHWADTRSIERTSCWETLSGRVTQQWKLRSHTKRRRTSAAIQQATTFAWIYEMKKTYAEKI